MSASPDQQWSIISRQATVLPEEQLRERLRSGDRLRVKLGLDPTAPDVHLGWAVVLRKLRAFQDLGHTAVLIVGDFTARIGDPSGQNKTRPMLDSEQIRGFADKLIGQFGAILDTDKLEVRYNSEWLEPLGVEGILKLAARMTVARMLERDDFAKRFADQTPISVTEFLYPLLQGYDSVAVEAGIELGGNDQLFNLHVGRHLQPEAGQTPQILITVPLLEGTDGVEKMSQSKGNYISISESPDEMFGKLMRVPDALMDRYFRLTTDLTDNDIDGINDGVSSGTIPPAEAKRTLASEVVKLYHGDAAALSARERFDKIFVHHEVPDDIAEASIPAECTTDGLVSMPRLMKEIGLASSASEAKRLIAQGGVRVDGKQIESDSVEAASLRGQVLQVGRRKFVRLV